MKRKNVIKNLNNTSGETPHDFFNKEVNRMANKDDNVQPEVLTDLNNIIINKKEKKPKRNKIKQKS